MLINPQVPRPQLLAAPSSKSCCTSHIIKAYAAMSLSQKVQACFLGKCRKLSGHLDFAASRHFGDDAAPSTICPTIWSPSTVVQCVGDSVRVCRFLHLKACDESSVKDKSLRRELFVADIASAPAYTALLYVWKST